MVVPSSRNWAKPSSSWPALTIVWPVGVLEVGERAAVHFLGHLFRIGIDRIGVVPGEVQERVGEGAAVLAVHLAQAVEDARP